MSDTPILRVENLSKSYGDLEVLKSVSFDVYKGETKAFIGPSGTGKSTLLRCINQLTVPDDGHVYLNGEEITHSGSKIIMSTARRWGWCFRTSTCLII